MIGCNRLPTNGVPIQQLTKDDLDYEKIIPKEMLEEHNSHWDYWEQDIIESYGIDSFYKWQKHYEDFRRRELENIWNYEVNKDCLDIIPTHTYFYEGIPYNGIAYKRDYPGGFILNIWFFIRSGGKIMNVYRFEGWEEYNFKNGKKHGSWERNGQEDGDFYLLKSGGYKNGLKDGIEKQWDNKGSLMKEDHYKDGKLINEDHYYKDGKFISK